MKNYDPQPNGGPQAHGPYQVEGSASVDRDEKGQGLALALIVVAFGALVVGALLQLLTTSFRVQGVADANVRAHYAAAGGVETVLADVVQGVDVLSGGYVPTVFSLNGYTPTVTLASGTASAIPLDRFEYVDPGAGTALNPLPASGTHTFSTQVPAGSDLQVNWPFTGGGSWSITVRRGGQTVGFAEGASAPGTILVAAAVIVSDTYAIAFFNDSGLPSTAAAFSSTENPNNTWVRKGPPFRDLAITSTVEQLYVTP